MTRLQSIRNLQVDNDFMRLNFEPGVEKDSNGIEQPIVKFKKNHHDVLRAFRNLRLQANDKFRLCNFAQGVEKDVTCK
jgi:hypothetical protein